jgi:hypothetical protein
VHRTHLEVLLASVSLAPPFSLSLSLSRARARARSLSLSLSRALSLWVWLPVRARAGTYLHGRRWQIFGTLYPSSFSNWYADPWLCDIYQAFSSFFHAAAAGAALPSQLPSLLVVDRQPFRYLQVTPRVFSPNAFSSNATLPVSTAPPCAPPTNLLACGERPAEQRHPRRLVRVPRLGQQRQAQATHVAPAASR